MSEEPTPAPRRQRLLGATLTSLNVVAQLVRAVVVLGVAAFVVLLALQLTGVVALSGLMVISPLLVAGGALLMVCLDGILEAAGELLLLLLRPQRDAEAERQRLLRRGVSHIELSALKPTLHERMRSRRGRPAIGYPRRMLYRYWMRALRRNLLAAAGMFFPALLLLQAVGAIALAWPLLIGYYLLLLALTATFDRRSALEALLAGTPPLLGVAGLLVLEPVFTFAPLLLIVGMRLGELRVRRAGR